MFFSTSTLSIELNGFQIDDSLVKNNEILKGGPPKDGIPALLYPNFVDSYQGMTEIESYNDKAIIVKVGNTTKAYPISILNWHEIVNDKIEGDYFVVTYCPLCGTAIVFDSPNRNTTFGVSGLLYQSDVLLYDHRTNSLWSQIMQKAITGKLKNSTLTIKHSKTVNLKKFLQKHPTTLVMSKETKYAKYRDYNRDPYDNYSTSYSIYFPIKNIDSRYHPKNLSIYINFGGIEKILVLDSLNEKKGTFEIKVKKKVIKIYYDKDELTLFCQKNKGLKCITGYWFALKTFFPYADIIKPQITSSP